MRGSQDWPYVVVFVAGCISVAAITAVVGYVEAQEKALTADEQVTLAARAFAERPESTMKSLRDALVAQGVTGTQLRAALAAVLEDAYGGAEEHPRAQDLKRVTEQMRNVLGGTVTVQVGAGTVTVGEGQVGWLWVPGQE